MNGSHDGLGALSALTAIRRSVEWVRAFCSRREVDLTIARPPEPFDLSLHADFDAEGDLFSMLVAAPDYGDTPGSVTVGDLLLTHMQTMSRMARKWANAEKLYSGRAGSVEPSVLDVSTLKPASVCADRNVAAAAA